MATLNVSLPTQLRSWVSQQVDDGKYASASDYLRDLIRSDIRRQEQGLKWLADHLQPLTNTPDEEFIKVTADDVKARVRNNDEDQK